MKYDYKVNRYMSVATFTRARARSFRWVELLSFSPDALKNYKEGDQVSIAIAKRSGMTESAR